MECGFASIAIVGHGLIGGSIELALGERCPEARAIVLDRDSDLRRAAPAGLIVLAAPIRANNQLLSELRTLVGRGTLITDTGSTKVSTLAAAEGLRFIGGHPIAGAASGGRESARPDLFEGRRWILTPAAASRQDDLARLREFIGALGARVSFMDAADHDRLFAYVSHLPQLLVSTLMQAVGREVGVEGLEYAGAGLRDATRLAGSPSDIWRDIMATNGSNISAAIDSLMAALVDVRDDARGEALAWTFQEAAKWRRVLEDAGPDRGEA